MDLKYFQKQLIDKEDEILELMAKLKNSPKY